MQADWTKAVAYISRALVTFYPSLSLPLHNPTLPFVHLGASSLILFALKIDSDWVEVMLQLLAELGPGPEAEGTQQNRASSWGSCCVAIQLAGAQFVARSHEACEPGKANGLPIQNV